jgi:hypothetical protein
VRRHDHDAALGEELEVRASTGLQRTRDAWAVHRRGRTVPRPRANRRRNKRDRCGKCEHLAHGIPLLTVVALLAGCGGSSSSSPSITVQAARAYSLAGFSRSRPVAGHPIRVTFEIVQPDGEPLTRFRRGSGPHTGVHLIIVRSDLRVIIHHHPPVAPDGRITDTITYPTPGVYRAVVDVYPAQTSPQPNFQLFARIRVPGAYTPQRLPPLQRSETIDGYRFTLHGVPHLRAIEPALLTFSVAAPNGEPASFTPWFGALAHAIFFRRGSLDYFHTHVCAPGATGCASVLGGARITGSSSTPGTLKVGVLVPVAGTWRLFLQCKVGGRVLTAPFTLTVR